LTLDWEMTLDDYEAGLPYILSKSRPGRRRINLIRLGLTIFIIGPFVWLRLSTGHSPLGTALVGLIGAAVIWFRFPRSYGLALDMRASAISGDKSRWLGHCTLEAAESGLSWTYPSGSGFTPWSKFTGVESDERSVYLFQGVNAWVVPSKAFSDIGQQERFVTLAGRSIASAS
jgi:hypothetical protein